MPAFTGMGEGGGGAFAREITVLFTQVTHPSLSFSKSNTIGVTPVFANSRVRYLLSPAFTAGKRIFGESMKKRGKNVSMPGEKVCAEIKKIP